MQKIIIGDAREVMKTLPDNLVHLIVTSPPYGNLKIYGDSEKEIGSPQTFEDYIQSLNQVWNECYRVLHDGCKLCVNLGDQYVSSQKSKSGGFEILPIQAHILSECHKRGWIFTNQFIWHKTTNVNSSGGATKVLGSYLFPRNGLGLTKYEYIIILKKPGKDPKPSPEIKEASKLTKEEWLKYFDSIWEIQGTSQKKFPAAFPIEIPRRLIKMYSFVNDTVLDPFMGCYSEDTEVLTYNGWMYFKDLKGNEKFVTLSTNGELEYQPALAHQKYYYEGEMYSITHRSCHLLVTPNHNMLIWSRSNREYRKIKSLELKNIQDISDTIWIPQSCRYIPINHIDRRLMYLLGLYVSEGFIARQKNRKVKYIIICQHQKRWNQIYKWLEGLDIQPKGNRQLKIKILPEILDWIIENCGEKAYNKFLSPYILNSDNLDALYEAMLFGDGCIATKSNLARYYTISPKLRDAFLEICLKLGYNSSYGSRLRKPSEIRGRSIKPKYPCWEISVRRSKFLKLKHRNHFFLSSYKGYVYCVTVPNHTLYVRREGRPCWCGNSGTTLVAAEELGRNGLGIELYENYALLAKERLPIIKIGGNI